MNKIYSESELDNKIYKIYKEEQLKVIQEKWDNLSGKDKRFVLEMLKQLYPEKSMLISESKWYNTVGDIVGIFDPTGVVDLINGISYWRQGDKLFAILSWISVIPYLGDAIGKSAMGVFKLGGFSAKAFKSAAIAGKASEMAKIAKSSGPLEKLISGTSKWGPKILEPLKKAIGKVPGVGPGLIKGVEDWIKLFSDANKTMKSGQKTAINLTRTASTRALTKAESEQLKTALKQSTSFRGFRDYTGKGGLSAGMFRLWGNRGTRGLMRRTKWYLGLLDFLGLGNFVGPEELETQIEDLDKKVEQYSNTQEAQNLINQDLSQYEEPETVRTFSAQTPIEPKKNDIQTNDLFAGLFA